MTLRFGLLFWINTVLFVALGLGVPFINIFGSNHPVHYFISLTILSVIFFLPGQNITALIEQTTRQSFTFLEKLALIVTLSFVVAPFLFSLITPHFTQSSVIIPFWISAITWISAVYFAPNFWENTKPVHLHPNLIPGLIITTLVFTVFIFELTTTYYALPDLDPYYWLQQFQKNFSQPIHFSLQEHRPLFSSIGYLFVQVAHIDAYAFFKYLIPIFFLAIIFPATLLASQARNLQETLLIFFLPTASSSFLLYSVSSLPQSLANLLLLSGFFFMLYATYTKQSFFFLFGGFSIFSGIFYHEVNTLFFIPWFFLLCFRFSHQLFALLRHNWFSTLLFLLLIITSFDTLGIYISFIINWIDKIIHALLQFQANFSFPATYINIDGNAVGWGNATGIIRYYAFYFGPLAGIITLYLFLLYLTKRATLRSYWLSLDFLEKNVFSYFFIIFILFLSIAELLPRFFNIALLPERALGFVACTIVFLFAFFLIRLSPLRVPMAFFFFLAIGITLGGALYINSIKQYLITSNQIASAEWIRGTLPKESIFFTNTQNNLLRFHAQVSTVIGIDDPALYTDIHVFEKSLQLLPSASERLDKEYQNLLLDMRSRLLFLEQLEGQDITIASKSVFPTLISQIQDFLTQYGKESVLSETSHKITPLYIYYARVSDRNPYANRPYMQKHDLIKKESPLIFDQYPDRFTRVYSLPENEVVIWEFKR